MLSIAANATGPQRVQGPLLTISDQARNLTLSGWLETVIHGHREAAPEQENASGTDLGALHSLHVTYLFARWSNGHPGNG
jgi:hypothetical protein